MRVIVRTTYQCLLYLVDAFFSKLPRSLISEQRFLTWPGSKSICRGNISVPLRVTRVNAILADLRESFSRKNRLSIPRRPGTFFLSCTKPRKSRRGYFMGHGPRSNLLLNLSFRYSFPATIFFLPSSLASLSPIYST